MAIFVSKNELLDRLLGAPPRRYAVRPRLREGPWLQQKGRPPRSEYLSNRSSRLLGTHPAQVGVAEVQICQVGEAAQLRRYLPAQVVFAEVQQFQVGEAAQLHRYPPFKSLLWRSSALRLARLPNSGGISPLKLFSLRSSFGDAAVVVSGDAYPLANRHVAPPVPAQTNSSRRWRYRGQSTLPGPFRRSRRPRAALSQSQVQAHRWRWARPLTLSW